MRLIWFLIIVFLFQGLSAQNQFERGNLNFNFSYPDQIEKGDIDGDGLLDLVFGSTYQDRVAWIRNEGNNQFADYVELDLDYEQLNGIHLIDFDQDGDLDILTYGARPSNIVGLVYTDGPFVWFENDGVGGFQKHAIAFDITEFIDLKILDYDGDGDLDLSSFSGIVGLASTGIFSMSLFYANQGDELFTVFANDTTEGRFSDLLFDFADFDNDGDLDMIGGLNNKLQIHENLGGTFDLKYDELLTQRNPVTVDFDNDGDMDILSSGDDLSISRNLGDFNFQFEILLDKQSRNLKLSDVDGDGIEDLVFEHLEFVGLQMSIKWIKLPVTGTNISVELIEPEIPALDFALADFDNDGNSSLVYLPTTTGAYMRNLDIDSEFEEILPAFDLDRVIRSVDMNADGLNDIVVFEETAYQFLWLENFGGGEYSSAQVLWTIQEVPESFDLANVYGSDGIELVYQDSKTNVVTPLANAVNHLSFSDYGSVTEIKLADLNGNGLHSLLLSTSDELHLLDIVNSLPLPLGTLDLEEYAVGDVNGDEWLDIVWADMDKLYLAYGNADYQYPEEEIASVFGGVELGDFNGDGQTDIFVNENNENQFFIEQLEPGQFGEPVLIWQSAGANIIVEDFDGDNLDEVCVIKNRDLELINWLGDGLQPQSTGTSRFTPQVCCSNFDSIDFDVDGDGDLDIINIDTRRKSIAIIENIPGLPRAEYIIIEPCPLTFLNTSVAFYPDTELTWLTESGETSESITTFTPEITAIAEMQNISLILCNSVGCDTMSTAQVQGIEYIELDVPTQALVGEPVDFSIDSPGATNWTWVFGDGEIALEQNTTHTYQELGVYTVEYFVTNSELAGCTNQGALEIEIVDDLAIDEIDQGSPFVVATSLGSERWTIENLDNEPFRLELISLLGKTIISEKATSQMEFSLDAFPIGTYLLVLKSDDAVHTQKIVKAWR